MALAIHAISKIKPRIPFHLRQTFLVFNLAFLFLFVQLGSAVLVKDPTFTSMAFAQFVPPNSVGTAELKKHAVTTQKLAPASVGTNKIKNGAVTSAKIKDGTIQLVDLDPSIPTQGEQGIQGIAGVDGADGADGAKGDTGEQGIQGIAGVDGNDGADGTKGDTGDQGIQGIAGTDGAKGDTGDQGIQGIAGTDGADGTKGDTGDQGIQGIAGTDGADGTKGDTGDQGIQGIAGADGADGAKGDTGDQGIQGVKGDTGDQGIQGVAGADGGNDDADGVEITFAQEIDFDPGTGSVPSLDLNGTNLHISGTTPTVTLGETPLTVLLQGDIEGSIYQQIIVQLPGGLLPGDYRIAVQNSQGDSAFDTTLGEGNSGGGSGSIPSGAVMHFNLASCPTDWTFLLSAQGRYLVGVNSGGTVGLAVGTGLSDQENRAVGQHGHSASANAAGNHGHSASTDTTGNHSHSASTGTAGAHTHSLVTITLRTNVGAWNPSFQRGPITNVPDKILSAGNHAHSVTVSSAGNHSHSVTVNSAGDHSHSVSVDNAGSVSGTNAPYLQLLTCQKN